MISHVRPIHARITFWVLLLGENLQLPFLAYHIFCFTFIAIVLYSVLKVPDLVPFGTKSQISSSRSGRPSFRLTPKPTIFAAPAAIPIGSLRRSVARGVRSDVP